MAHTLILHAHPRPRDSRVTAALGRTLAGLPGARLHPLYDRYPDFDIDVAAEQDALAEARLIVWLAPVYWYSVPGLLKHWFDTVLAHGWAYGHGADGAPARALAGKTAWWVASAGGTPGAYQPGGAHGRPFAEFVAPVEHVARFCGMHWLPPFVAHGGHAQDDDTLRARCAALAGLARGHQAALGLGAEEAAA